MEDMGKRQDSKMNESEREFKKLGEEKRQNERKSE